MTNSKGSVQEIGINLCNASATHKHGIEETNNFAESKVRSKY